MAQIIRHRRGSLEALSAATSSFQKGELIIVSGSSNITATNGSGMVFAAVESGSIQAVNRFLVGTNAPNVFSSSVYNGLVKGVPYYASGSSTLYLLGSDKNDIPDLTGNISNFSASVATSFSSSRASVTALSASVASVTGDFSSSVATSFSASNASIVALSASVASVTGDFSSSVAQTFTTQSQRISSLESFSGSSLTRFSNLESTSASVNTSIAALNSSSASQQISIDALNSYTSSNTSTTALNNFTASAETRFTEIGVVSGSLISSASTAKTTNDTQDGRLTNLESFSGSQLTQNTALATITGSLITSASNAAIAIANLNSNSGSYAKLDGGNNFNGTQVFTGSVFITGSLTVYGSSSFANVSASIVDIGTNTIKLSTATPAVRFGGISVSDSGSGAGASGSLFWDSLNNNWVYQHPSGGVESGMSAILISGPLNSGSLGNETHITPGKIMVATGDDHIGDSIITQLDNSKVNIGGGLGVSGSIIVNNDIIGTGSIFLQPDITDSRKLQIYNTATTDVHIKSTGGLTFLGDDTNYVKIDDSLQTVTVRGVNGVFIETALNVTGPISASAGFSGSIEGIGNVTAYSQSVSASLASITANVGAGVGVSITNLNSFSSSTLGRLSNIELFSSSVETKLTEIGVVSGSLIASASTAKSTNDTQDGRLTNLEATSASVNTSVSNLNTFSASVNTSVSALNSSSASQQISIDALNTVSGSNLSRLSNLETTSASVNTSVSALNSSSASQQISIDALNVVSGSNLGRLTNLETTSASVNTSITNINSFTSSVDTKMTEIGVVSGSLISSASAASISIAALNAYTSSNTSTTALNNFTASAETRFTEIGVVSGSLIASASTAKTTNDTQDGRLTNLETTSASVNTSVSALNSFSSSTLGRLTNLETTSASVNTSVSALNTSSASQQISIDALNTVSGSNLGRLSNLETTSASVNTSISALNTSSASQQTSIDALNVVSSSNLGRLSQLETASGSAKIAISDLNNFTSSFKQAFSLSGQNVEIQGDLTVKGTTTSISSTTVQIGDNIIELNGTGAANGGLLVKDPTAPSTASGSLLWDSTNDYWKGGTLGNESKLLRAGGDNVVTASAQVLLTQLDGFSSFDSTLSTITGSLISSASAAKTTNDSQGVSITNLNSFTSSINTTIKTKLDTDGVISGSSQLTSSYDTRYVISGSLTQTTWDNIANKPGGIVSGSSQVDITETTGFSTFSASIETRISIIDGGTY
jgi:uncharacterized coiled-coil protein SlyX